MIKKVFAVNNVQNLLFFSIAVFFSWSIGVDQVYSKVLDQKNENCKIENNNLVYSNLKLPLEKAKDAGDAICFQEFSPNKKFVILGAGQFGDWDLWLYDVSTNLAKKLKVETDRHLKVKWLNNETFEILGGGAGIRTTTFINVKKPEKTKTYKKKIKCGSQ